MDAVGDRTMHAMPQMQTSTEFAPELHPSLYENVQRRRVLAFLIDMTLVGVLTVFGAFLVMLLGIMTLGLGWALFAILVPAIVLGYAALGTSRYSATLGMRVLGLTMRSWTGGAVDG